MKITVEIPKAKMQDLVKRMEGVAHSFDVEARPVLIEESERLTGRVQELSPVYTGALRRSVSYKISGNGFSLSSKITSALPYAPPVEFGISPRRVFPPFSDSALELWTRRRLGKTGKALKTTTYLIAKKIFRNGILAVKMFERAFNENKSRIENRFRRVVNDFFSKF